MLLLCPILFFQCNPQGGGGRFQGARPRRRKNNGKNFVRFKGFKGHQWGTLTEKIQKGLTKTFSVLEQLVNMVAIGDLFMNWPIYKSEATCL